jgi:two-component system sensor histidine kinase AlgZ
VERYLAIEQTRLGARLRTEFEIVSETLDALVPIMLLQPLVENAIRHGIAPRMEGGTVAVRSRIRDKRLQILIANSGLPAPIKRRTPENGVGLTNTRERLNALYGEDHRFAIEWPEHGGCAVTVELPLRPCPSGQDALVCAR